MRSRLTGKFKNFIETTGSLGDDYWANRLKQFQAAAAGQKGAIAEKPTQKATYKSGQHRRPYLPSTPTSGVSRPLTPQEVLTKGLHPHHVDVWVGSTADAPVVYPYVYIKRLNKYMTNPAYRG